MINKNKRPVYKNNMLRITDMLNNDEDIYRGLLDYFVKNFDLDIEKLKREYL